MNKSVAENHDELWRERLQELESSGLTQKEWCRQHEVSESTLRYWIRKLRTNVPKEKTEWMHLPMSAGMSEVASGDLTVSRSGVSLIISPAADPVLAREAMKVLMQP
ncbi:MAG: transposase [Bacillota bacterium]|nr:transposase [Bacillota bacterium]